MKSFSSAATILLAAPFIFADDAKPGELKNNILVEMQVVAIPRATALPIVRDLMDPQKIDAAYLKIQDLLEKNTAKLIGWPMLGTRSGERSVVEGIEEVRYATEYTPASVNFYLPDGTKTEVNPSPEVLAKIEGTTDHAIPSAFETRNTGIFLEVEAKLLPDEKNVELNFSCQDVRFKEMTKITLEHEKSREKVIVEQPKFDTMKTATKVTIRSGERMLAGIYQPSEPPDYLEIFILHVEVRKLP